MLERDNGYWALGRKIYKKHAILIFSVRFFYMIKKMYLWAKKKGSVVRAPVLPKRTGFDSQLPHVYVQL